MPSILDRYRTAIDAELQAVLAAYPSPIQPLLRYHLGWLDEHGNALSRPVGKALRPALCLLACEAASGAYEQALPAAAALELVHGASLIYDDIQDDDRERRHRPTVWAVWGKRRALAAGTAMACLAGLALARLADRGVPARKRLATTHLLNQTCLHLAEGQYLDISHEGTPDVAVADYLATVGSKTAAMFACSLEVGARLGTDDEPAIRRCRELGKSLGHAFQLRDDILGIWGDGARTGKPVGSDVRCRKKTYPIVFALERSTGRARSQLQRIYRREAIDDGALSTVRAILHRVGALERTQRMVEAYCDLALAQLASLSLPPWARAGLAEMILFLMDREL